MIARLLISPSLETRVGEIDRTLASHLSSGNSDVTVKTHPDVLYFEADSKLGIEQARIIKDHFSLKPYSAKGRVVVLENASVLTVEAQNALLKTLEEPPEGAMLLLGAKSESDLLPTVLSRCEIVILDPSSVIPAKVLRSRDPQDRGAGIHTNNFMDDITKLLSSSIEERFEYIEKLKEREEFLHALVAFFHQKLRSHMSSGNSDYKNFLKELLQAEEWAAQNVNIRAILEYLMLVMPAKI